MRSSKKAELRAARRRQAEIRRQYGPYFKAQKEFSAVWKQYQRSLPQYDAIWAGFEVRRVERERAARKKKKAQQLLARFVLLLVCGWWTL